MRFYTSEEGYPDTLWFGGSMEHHYMDKGKKHLDVWYMETCRQCGNYYFTPGILPKFRCYVCLYVK